MNKKIFFTLILTTLFVITVCSYSFANTNAGNNVKDEVPNTGDNNVLSYSFILMVLSAVGIFFATEKRKSYK